MKRFLGIVLGLSLCTTLLFAQDRNDAVVYIQGDRETPIYIKMEGAMVERESKHYVILNSLASGPLNLEVLFQQNKYPAQKFVLNLAPSAQRSLVLKKINEQQFALYDLNYGIYLNAGNKLSDDIDQTSAAPVAKTEKVVEEVRVIPKNVEERVTREVQKSDESVESEAVAKAERKAEKEAAIQRRKDERYTKEFARQKEQAEKEAAALAKVEKDREQRFLDFELDKKDKEATPKTSSKNTNTKFDCDEETAISQFENFTTRFESLDDEEQKLRQVKKQVSKFCFTTAQVKQTALKFVSQSSRYEVVRVMKDRVVDPQAYLSLEELFNTNYLKNRFKEEVVGK